MAKISTFLGYSFASLGVAFFVITVIFIFTSTIQLGSLTVTFPYRPLVGPALVTGLIFFNAGIFGIWTEYLRVKRRQENLLKYKLKQSE
jgi:hypothetical protein